MLNLRLTKRICIGLMLAMLLTMLAGCTFPRINRNQAGNFFSGGRQAQADEAQQMPIDGQTRLYVKNTTGIVDFKPVDGDQLQINAVKKVRGNDRQEELEELLENIRIEIDKDTNEIRVQVKIDREIMDTRQYSADLEIKVPKKIVSLQGDSTSGEILLWGFANMEEISLAVSSGNMNVSDVTTKEFTLKMTSGSVKVRELEGNGSIRSSSGNTTLDRIKGNLDFKATSGKLDVDGFEGILTADVSSGSMDIQNCRLKASSSFHATSGNMDIDILELDSAGNYKISASSGNIRLHLPQGTGFILDARASSGNIDSDFPVTVTGEVSSRNRNRLKGVVGNGGPAMDIEVTSGNVRILDK